MRALLALPARTALLNLAAVALTGLTLVAFAAAAPRDDPRDDARDDAPRPWHNAPIASIDAREDDTWASGNAWR